MPCAEMKNESSVYASIRNEIKFIWKPIESSKSDTTELLFVRSKVRPHFKYFNLF